MKTNTLSPSNALSVYSFVCQLSLTLMIIAAFVTSTGLNAQTFFFEDFETTENLPGALPAGWSTSQTNVTGIGIENSFQIWNSQTVNSVGYFPAPERGNNNHFAAMRNANAQCACDNDLAYLETPSFDFIGIANPALHFSIFNPDFEDADRAWVSGSIDDGLSWQIIGYVFETDTITNLPDHPDDWKSIALNLEDYAGASNVKIRFFWRNQGTTTLLSPIDYLGSGYAIDDVKIDEFDNFNITNERTHIANVYASVMSAPYVPYTMIPLNQVYPISCNSMVYNTGLSELNNLRIFAEIFKLGISQGTWTSPLTDSLNVLNKVDISITTGYTPDAVGQYEIRSSAFCSDDETNLSDNESNTRFAVTECTYANDYGEAYGSYQLNADEYGGNVFHVVQSDIFSSLQVAIHEKTPIGATIKGRVYEFDSIDVANGEPIFIPVANGFTSSHLITEGDLTTTTNTKFICLPFENGLYLDDAKSYLFAVECDTTFYISFSGGNDVTNINTLVYSESETKFFERRKTIMVRAIGSCSEPCLTENPAGCTNPNACNYNLLAITDDGSCLLVGSSCDDGNECTIDDVLSNDCVCDGTPIIGCIETVLTILANDTTIECSDFFIDQPLPFSVNGGCSNPQVSFADAIIQNDPCLTLVERTWTAVDDCGNQSTLTTTISIVDTSAPVFYNLENSVLFECGNASPLFPIVEIIDNCDDSPSTSLLLGDTIQFNDCPAHYYYSYFLVAEDQCGNTTTEFIEFEQVDSQPPVFYSTNESLFYFDYGVDYITPTPLAYDNCNSLFDLTSFDSEIIWSSCQGTIYRTWLAQDECGNSSSFIQTIVISTNPIVDEIPCDDDNPCTINDFIDVDCQCHGTLIDTNNDGVCNEGQNCNDYVTFWQFSENTSITACFNGSHTWVSDLSFYLVGPPGCGSPQILLAQHPDTTCNGGNNFYNFCFTNDTSLPFDVCTAQTPLSGNYGAYRDGSEINWSALNNCNIYESGWSLQILDCIELDLGSFGSGEIVISENNAFGDTAYIQLSTPPGFNSPIIDNACNSQNNPIIELQIETTYFSGPYGNTCDDNNPCTINDIINTDCVCIGTPVCNGIIITEQPQSIDACLTQDVFLSVTATGTNLSYQWYRNGIPVNGATNYFIYLSSLNDTNAGSYHVVIFNGSESVVSNNAIVNVYYNCNEIVINNYGCDPPGFYLDAYLYVTSPPTTGILTVSSSCGSYYETFFPPFESSIYIRIEEFASYNSPCMITAEFSALGAPQIEPASYIMEACCTPLSPIQDLPETASTCQNSSNTTLSVWANGFGIDYVWYSSASPNGPFSIIPGVNSPSFTPPTATIGTTYYYCFVSTYFSCFSNEAFYSTVCAFTVLPATIEPTFDHFGPYCSGSSIPALPTTSSNGITGSWSQAINNQTTTTYTFTPDADQCSFSYSTTIPITQVPTVVVNNSTICNGTFASVSATVTPAGNYNYIWNVPSGVPNPGNVASFNTAIAGNYSVVVSQSCIDSSLIQEFYACPFDIAPVCGCDGISYENYCVATFQYGISSLISGECNGTENFICPSAPATGTVTILPALIPTFGNFGPYCAGSSIPALPSTSTNGVQGSWSPAINNQTTTTYTFTPSSGQCASSVTRTISITPNTTPSFGTFGPYCAGSSIPALPTTSTNGIQGSWSPAINNSATTTYTFTPNSGQCASSVTTTINITPTVVPSFNAPSPYCQSSAFPALPTTSNNGISGTWAPTVNNQTTTTYTFTPDAGSCAATVDVTISILPSITPTFSFVSNYCEGANIPVLPTTSDNGITGSWSPAINNQITTGYVFTPAAGQCAVTTAQTIAIGAAVNAQISVIGNNTVLSCNNPQITLVATGGNSYSWSGGLGNASIAIVNAPGSYTVTASSSAGCQDTQTIIITEAIVNTPFAGNDGQVALCSNDAATDLFNYLGGAAQTGGVWSGPSGTIAGGIYNPTLHVPGIYQYVVNDATGCASDTAQVVISETTFIQPDVQYDSPFCPSETELQLPTTVTPSNGTFSVSPNTGLSIQPNGAINPSLSTTGTYSVTYSIGGACEASDVALVIIEEIPNAVIQASALVVCPGETVTLSANGGVTYLWSNGSTDASITVNESEVGAYYAVATNDGGCSDVSNTINLSLGTLPTPTITAFGSLSICPGESVTLAASGGSDWLWNTGQTTQTIEAEAAGDYWVIVTNALGCSDTSSSVVIDNFNGAGTTISPASNITICAGDQVTLTAQPAGQDYLWSTGEISQSITVDTTGVYSVSTINTNGCAGTASVSVEAINSPPTLTIPDITICGGETATLCAAPADAYEWTSSTNANFQSSDACITVSEGGTYTVTMTNGGLCSSTGDVTVEAISFVTCYQDLDGDGFGNDNITIQSCECPPGYSTQPGDCNDNDLGMSPALVEICGDNIDNDCDGLTDGFCDVLGCTDPNACPGSYNPDANTEDGTCIYPGCTYPSATNYDPSAGCDDGSCTFAPPIEGCIDVTACNYNPVATTDDGSCTYPGCSDPNACNYSAAAGCDDGSCDYLTLYPIDGDSLYQTPEAFCETSYWYPSTPGSTYTWNAAGGTVDAQLQGTDSIVVFWANEGLGSVSVYETTESGCIGTTVTLSVTIQPNADNDCPTRVGEQTILQLSAYPNPTTGNFTLQIEEQVRGAELMVYDALGKLIEQRPISSLQTTIESEQWSAGVYTLLIRTDDSAASLRVVKE